VVDRRWYVAVTNPNEERLARDAVNADSEFSGAVAFLPLDKPREVLRTVRGRVVSRRSIPVVLMAGYLFVSFDHADGGWRRLYGTPGVKKLLGLDPMRPQPIDDGFIAGLMLSASKEGVVPDAVQTMVGLGATVEALGHSWMAGRKGQQHDAPRVLTRITLGSMAFDAWLPGAVFGELRA
jgi:transcription antitermination factor NusG